MHGGKHAGRAHAAYQTSLEAIQSTTQGGKGLAFALRGGIMLPDDAQSSESATLASRYEQAVVCVSRVLHSCRLTSQIVLAKTHEHKLTFAGQSYF